MSQTINATRDQITAIKGRISDNLFMSAARQVTLQYRTDVSINSLPLFYDVNFEFDDSNKTGRAEIKCSAKFRHPNCVAVCDLELDDAEGNLPQFEILDFSRKWLSDFPLSISGSLHVEVPESAVLKFMSDAKKSREIMISRMMHSREQFGLGFHGGSVGVVLRVSGITNKPLDVRAVDNRSTFDGIFIDANTFKHMSDADLVEKVDEQMSNSIYAGFAREEV